MKWKDCCPCSYHVDDSCINASWRFATTKTKQLWLHRRWQKAILEWGWPHRHDLRMSREMVRLCELNSARAVRKVRHWLAGAKVKKFNWESFRPRRNKLKRFIVRE